MLRHLVRVARAAKPPLARIDFLFWRWQGCGAVQRRNERRFRWRVGEPPNFHAGQAKQKGAQPMTASAYIAHPYADDVNKN
jgi:hypothetical protein